MLLLKVASPIILTIGIVGNLVSFCIFRSDKMKHLPTFKFLSYLSLIDCLYILIGIPHIMAITFFNYDFRNTTNLICSIHSFLTIYLSHLSSNVLAAIGVFRCIELTSTNIINNSSLLVKKNKSRVKKGKNIVYSSNQSTLFECFSSCFGKAELIILAILIVLFIFDSHFLLLMRLSEQNIANNQSNLQFTNKSNIIICHPSFEKEAFYFEFYVVIWPWVDMVLYSYVPFIIMITSTCLIIGKLCKANKNLNDKNRTYYSLNIEMSNAQTDEQTITIKQKRNELIYEEMKRRTKRNNQVYKLLISLNMLFFVMVTPLVLCNSLKVLKIENELVLEFVYILAYLNHCLNFIFYSLSCELYRSVLFKYFRKIFQVFKNEALNNTTSVNKSNQITT